MAVTTKPGWNRPSTILFASEIPANEKALGFATAQAKEFGANLILFHAYDTMVVAASETSGIRYYDYAAAARAEIEHLQPLAETSGKQGISCEIVVRPGLAADQILAFLRERAGGSHRDGNPLPRTCRKTSCRLRGRSRPAHRPRASLHHWPRRGGREVSQLRNQNHSLCGQPE